MVSELAQVKINPCLHAHITGCDKAGRKPMTIHLVCPAIKNNISYTTDQSLVKPRAVNCICVHSKNISSPHSKT